MEAVAAAASIAGILTVVGQSIDGLTKFGDFFSDISSASKTISRLLKDINSLIQVLEYISDVLERARAQKQRQNFASLDIKIGDCAKDVQTWLATARLLRPGSDSGGKAWLRKFRLAVNNTAIQTIRDEIGRHNQTLCLSLAVFGRYMNHLLCEHQSTGLAINNRSRTIDIDTSNQVHQIDGRFDEALSTSLSIHGAHEEALRRIEHYSMASMHTSAHSVRSMDSIRTELSRLEAMINSTSVTHLPDVEIVESHMNRGSNDTERRSSVVEEGGNPISNMSIPGQLPEQAAESSSARDIGSQFAPEQLCLDQARKSLDQSSISSQTKTMGAEHSAPRNHLSILDEFDGIHNPYIERATEEGYRSSVLYAEYSKSSQPHGNERSNTEVDYNTINNTMRQYLTSIYPPEIIEYISLRQVTTLCEGHIELLEKRPKVHILATGKMKEVSYVDDGNRASARPSMITLRDHLVSLQSSIRVSREQCLQAGYSLSELEKLLCPSGSGSCAPADRPPPDSKSHSGDDSSSVYSEDFHSSAE